MAKIRFDQRPLAGIVGVAKQRFATVSIQTFTQAAKLPATFSRVRDISEEKILPKSGSGGFLLGKSLFLLVIAPTIFFMLYAALWESDGYVAEARVTVRTAQEQRGALPDAASLIGKVIGSSKSTQQDSYIVLNYIKSYAILVDLGGSAYLENVFSHTDIDYFSKLKNGSPIEDLYKYWDKHVIASVDTVSAILTIKVAAFKPEDALKITQNIIELSEKLINTISMRNRKDAADRTEVEVAHSAQKLAVVRQKLLQFRNQNELIDPGSRAASIMEMVSKLTLEKIDVENSLRTLSGSLSMDAPSQRFQRSKLAAIEQQILALRNTLTNAQSDDNVAAQIANYERLKLDEQFAEKIFTISQNAFLRARQELDRQQLYLVTVVAPALPGSATFPKVASSTLLLFASLFVLWAIGALIVASVNDHMV